MGIFGALTTAVGGLQAQPFALENIAGNIANSQTTAFKRVDTSFSDLVADSTVGQQKAGGVLAMSLYTCCGDFQLDKNGFSVNGAGATTWRGFRSIPRPALNPASVCDTSRTNARSCSVVRTLPMVGTISLATPNGDKLDVFFVRYWRRYQLVLLWESSCCS